MHRVLVESSPLPAIRGPGRSAPGPEGLPVTNPRPLDTALLGAALSACGLGLVGVHGGLIWIIAGVWTVRWLGGRPVGLAWAVACLAAAARWGTISVADILAASRVLGPAVAVEPLLAAVGCSIALGAAVAEEAALDGFRNPDWPQRVMGGVVLLTLVATLAAPGLGASLPFSLSLWVGAAALGTATVLMLAPLARRLPHWAPSVAALAGLVLTGLDR